MRRRYYYWADYDLDGAFEFHRTEDYHPPASYSHLIGPFDTFSECKRELKRAFKDCISELKEGLILASQTKASRFNGGTG